MLPECWSHDAAVSRAGAGAGVVVVHPQVVTHLMSQRRPDRDGPFRVILRADAIIYLVTQLFIF